MSPATAQSQERETRLEPKKKTRFTETQIVKSIQEHEGGRDAKELYRELGITTAAFYKWRQRYSKTLVAL